MSIGTRIRALRKELRISMADLASEINKDRTTIYRYESGDIENMPTSVLVPLAKALNTTPAYLMGLTEDPSRESRVIFKSKQPFFSKVMTEARKQSGLTIEEIIQKFNGSIDEVFITQVENNFELIEERNLSAYSLILDLFPSLWVINRIEKSWKEHIQYALSPVNVTLEKYQDEEVFIHDLVEGLRNEYLISKIEKNFHDSIINLYTYIPLNDRNDIFDSILDYAKYAVTQYKAKHKQP